MLKKFTHVYERNKDYLYVLIWLNELNVYYLIISVWLGIAIEILWTAADKFITKKSG